MRDWSVHILNFLFATLSFHDWLMKNLMLFVVFFGFA